MDYMCQTNDSFYVAAEAVSSSLLKTLDECGFAPFVKHKSFIEMWLDTGPFRWYFDKGTCREIYPDIRWPEMVWTYKLSLLLNKTRRFLFQAKVTICRPFLSIWMKKGGNNGNQD